MATSLSEKEILSWSVSEIQDRLKRMRIQPDVNKDHLLTLCMDWVYHNVDSRIDHLEELLQVINLEDCSQEVLHQQMHTYEALLDSKPAAYKLFAKVNLAPRQEAAIKTSSPQNSKQRLAVIGGNLYEYKIEEGQTRSFGRHHCSYFDTERKQLVKFADIPKDCCREGHSVCKTSVGFAVTGGKKSDACAMYVLSTKSWSQLQNMWTKRWGHGSVYVRGMLFVIGGYGIGKANSVQVLGTDGVWYKGRYLV